MNLTQDIFPVITLLISPRDSTNLALTCSENDIFVSSVRRTRDYFLCVLLPHWRMTPFPELDDIKARKFMLTGKRDKGEFDLMRAVKHCQADVVKLLLTGQYTHIFMGESILYDGSSRGLFLDQSIRMKGLMSDKIKTLTVIRDTKCAELWRTGRDLWYDILHRKEFLTCFLHDMITDEHDEVCTWFYQLCKRSKLDAVEMFLNEEGFLPMFKRWLNRFSHIFVRQCHWRVIKYLSYDGRSRDVIFTPNFVQWLVGRDEDHITKILMENSHLKPLMLTNIILNEAISVMVKRVNEKKPPNQSLLTFLVAEDPNLMELFLEFKETLQAIHGEDES